jgi:effector-binding domain-containing protein
MQGLICGGLCLLLGACASRARPTTAAPITSNLTPPSERMTMDYEFQITHAPQRTLMAVHAEVHGGRELVSAIKGGLDQVWAYLKANGAKAGHNVVVYRTFELGRMMIDSGVQVDAPLPGNGTVVPVTTPGGTVVTTVHIGPYNKLGDASSALHQFCRMHDHPISGPTWEEYGDWTDDPSKLRTDVFVLVTK